MSDRQREKAQAINGTIIHSHPDKPLSFYNSHIAAFMAIRLMQTPTIQRCERWV